jgi:hypothetical protein
MLGPCIVITRYAVHGTCIDVMYDEDQLDE